MEAITMDQFLTGLQIALMILGVLVLYNLLISLAIIRRSLRRFEDLSVHVEDLMMKPFSMVEQILEWVVEMVEGQQKSKGKKGKKKK